MRAIAALAAAGLLLGGCAAPVLIGAGSSGGGFAAGWFANPGNDLSLFNAALKADAPLKAVWCIEHEGHLPPGVETYCQNIPTSAQQVPVTLIKVINAEMNEKASP